MKEYEVTLQKQKAFHLENQKESRIIEVLRNVWHVHYWFKSKFGHQIRIINGDEMPRHRNESASQKTLSFTGETTFLKENYILHRRE